MSKRINFDISEEEHKRLKIEAAKRGTTIKDLLLLAVKKLLKEK